MDKEMTIDLIAFINILKKRCKIIAFITISITALAAIISFYVLPPIYQAGTSIIIGEPNGEKREYKYDEILMYQNLAKTYSEIAKSRIVAQNAAKQLGENEKVEKIMQETTISIKQDTQILCISVKDESAEETVKITNALVSSFIEEARIIFPYNTLRVMDKAEVPKYPIQPRKLINTAIGFFIGITVSIGLILLLEILDSTIKTEEDVEKYLDLPILGMIPKNMEG